VLLVIIGVIYALVQSHTKYISAGAPAGRPVGFDVPRRRALSWRHAVLLDINQWTTIAGCVRPLSVRPSVRPSVSDRYSVGMATPGRQVNSRGRLEPSVRGRR